MAPKPTCWVARPSPSPLAPQLMEKPWVQASGPSLAPAWPGLPVSQGNGQRLPHQQAARAAPPTAQQVRASSRQQWLQLPPAPECGLSRVQDRAQGTDAPILWLWTKFLGNHGTNLPQSIFERREEGPSFLWDLSLHKFLKESLWIFLVPQGEEGTSRVFCFGNLERLACPQLSPISPSALLPQGLGSPA